MLEAKTLFKERLKGGACTCCAITLTDYLDLNKVSDDFSPCLINAYNVANVFIRTVLKDRLDDHNNMY